MRRAFSTPARAGGDVAHLAVGDDRAQRAAPDRLAAEDDRRAGKVVAREDGGGRGVDVAHEQREVLRRGLEADVAARAAEAARKDGAIVERHSASVAE